jgi:hypothetical protein
LILIILYSSVSILEFGQIETDDLAIMSKATEIVDTSVMWTENTSIKAQTLFIPHPALYPKAVVISTKESKYTILAKTMQI